MTHSLGEPTVELRTPTEWMEILGGAIADPDGWRTSTAPAFDAPISEEEFRRRYARSTVLILPTERD